MTDGIHANIAAIQNMEAACTRLASVVVDRLPSVERELRRVSEALDERCDELRHEITVLDDKITSANEDEDISWASSRIEDARDDLAKVKRRMRRLSEAGAEYTSHARKVHYLATDHTVLTRACLREMVDDLKAYFARSLDATASIASVSFASAVSGSTREAKEDLCAIQTTPVSWAIDIGVGDLVHATCIRNALAAIDEVHTDGVLPSVSVRDTSDEVNGYLQPMSGSQGLTVDHVAVRQSGPWPELTMVHETGHLLDLEGIGPKGSFATLSADPIVQGVLNAAKASKAIRRLEQMRANSNSSRHREYFSYLLKDQEIWARAYAQFIAHRSSNLNLKAQLQGALSAEEGRQWAMDDFLQIDAEIKIMFTKLGWLC